MHLACTFAGLGFGGLLKIVQCDIPLSHSQTNVYSLDRGWEQEALDLFRTPCLGGVRNPSMKYIPGIITFFVFCLMWSITYIPPAVVKLWPLWIRHVRLMSAFKKLSVSVICLWYDEYFIPGVWWEKLF